MAKTITAHRKRGKKTLKPITLAIAFVNLAFLAAIWRAAQLTYALTSDLFAAATTALAVGVPFYLWERLYHYETANRTQTGISVAGMVADVIAGVLFGVWDYWRMAGIPIDASASPLILAVALLAAHAGAAFVWYLMDDEITTKRQLAREMAESKAFSLSHDVMRTALEERAKTTHLIQDLINEYGQEPVRIMIQEAGYDIADFAELFSGQKHRSVTGNPPALRPARTFAAETTRPHPPAQDAPKNPQAGPR